jgi:multiple sugar transport system permease protein
VSAPSRGGVQPAASTAARQPLRLMGRVFDLFDRLFVLLTLLPTFLLVILTFLFPLVISAVLSVKGYSPDGNHLAAPFVGFDNYWMLLEDPRFIRSLYLTLLFTALAVLAELVLGLAIALLLDHELPGIRWFRSVMILPMMTTPIVAALAWKLMLDPTYGVINRLTGTDVIWLGQPWPAFAAVLAVNVWQHTPFVMVILLSALQSLNKEPLEAARIDGASAIQTFRHLTLPMLKPFILVVLVLRTIFEFRSFENVYILTGGGPGDATMLLSVFTYSTSFLSFDLSLGAAAAWIMLLISVVMCAGFLVVMRRQKEQS